MQVPGHPITCECEWCNNSSKYVRTRWGKYINVTAYLQKESPFWNTPPSQVSTEPCPPAEYRRGKLVIPKGKKRR